MGKNTAQPSDHRLASRHPTDYAAPFAQRRLGEGKVMVSNISAQGCMIADCPDLQRGERIEIALPVVGRLDCHVVWQRDDRAGLHFERILRLDDFMALLKVVSKHHTQKLR
jgi:PilZ domain